MHVTYDATVDAGYAKLSTLAIARTERVAARLLVDYSGDGQVVGCELLDASVPLELAVLRAEPEAREALRRIHDKARQSSEELANRFLIGIAADSGDLAVRRSRVAAHLKPDSELALLTELRRQHLL